MTLRFLNATLRTNLAGTEFAKLAPNLRQLNLDANQITAIDDKAFVGMTGLTTLYLPRNKLTSISASVFKGLTNVGFLYVFRIG